MPDTSEPRAHILVIDDETSLRSLLARILRLEGYTVDEAGTAREGLRRLEQGEFQVVLCDVKLPDGNGVELVGAIKKQHPDTEVILLTAYGNIPDGVQAIKNGAFDYLTKGDDQERILPLVSRALEKARLRQRIRHLEKQVGHKFSFEHIIGHSRALKQAVELARRVAPTDATVLLTGETGTGKEVFAQAIHHASPHREQPFVAVNCSALGKEILESELFGHRAGSFTGAVRDKKGLFEEANHGTLFLDEIGEMPPDLQAKLLRVLETAEFLKVGDTKPTRVQVRVVAATNRDLLAESEAGQFRQDLYYRLSVFTIHLPPLRDRRDDIPALARHFVQIFTHKMNRRTPPDLSAAFLERLQNYPWKGNIRELRNVLERALILCDGDTLEPAFLPSDFQTHTGSGTGPGLSLAVAESRQIRQVLEQTGGNKTEAARLLGIGLSTLYRKLDEYGIH
ncbi:MAG: sigma-54-dependent Fis family transcriptional regulator [Saprospiraceae bacterium]|jgi:two-component system NtrC family response regulator|nr:sigma-54-dependent Fis family transcriptional regulator [Saprospiraceae bacterium]